MYNILQYPKPDAVVIAITYTRAIKTNAPILPYCAHGRASRRTWRTAANRCIIAATYLQRADARLELDDNLLNVTPLA